MTSYVFSALSRHKTYPLAVTARHREASRELLRRHDAPREELEGLLDALAGLRARREERPPVRLADRRQIRLRERRLVREVRLVRHRHRRDRARDAHDRLPPRAKAVEGRTAGEVAREQDPPRAVEVRVTEER